MGGVLLNCIRGLPPLVVPWAERARSGELVSLHGVAAKWSPSGVLVPWFEPLDLYTAIASNVPQIMLHSVSLNLCCNQCPSVTHGCTAAGPVAGAGVTEGRGKPGGGGDGGSSSNGADEEHEDGLAPKASKGGFFKGLFGGASSGRCGWVCVSGNVLLVVRVVCLGKQCGKGV